MAATADVLVAYVPEASMGTAIEMWQAFKAGAHVFTISPLAENWVVKFLSQRVFATLDEFVAVCGLRRIRGRRHSIRQVAASNTDNIFAPGE